MTPLSYDMVSTPLATGMEKAIGSNGSGYDRAIVFTHYRCAMALFGVSTGSLLFLMDLDRIIYLYFIQSMTML